MSRTEVLKIARQFFVISILLGGLCFVLLRPQVSVHAGACEDSCGSDYSNCTYYCDSQANDCWNSGGWSCDQDRQSCYNSCDSQYNSCLSGCGTTGGDGGGGTPTGDGHIWCDGWDRQGDCAYQFAGVAAGATFRRQRGTNGYDWQTFLSWNPADMDGFGRFPMQDGNVGIISTSPEPGQVPLHRWSTRRGFYYSIYYGNYGSEYVYGGVAGYVWPAGDSRGYPLYQFYSNQYGHFYTNYKKEINCQPPVTWSDQGEMARVNWPAPFAQAQVNCTRNTLGPFPPACDPFQAQRCALQGRVWNPGNCICF